jgi:hypothetical protein
MKIYAVYPNEAGAEAYFYVEAKDIEDLKRILRRRLSSNDSCREFGMFPGWCPEEISKREMYNILNRFNEKDINLVDEDKRSDFALFARMQPDDAPIIEKLKKYPLYKCKYSVNLTENDID